MVERNGNGMAAKPGSANGPGYADVADYLMELTGTWGGSFSFSLAADRDRRGTPNLFVVLKRKPWTGDQSGRACCRVWSSWPCKGNVTFCGLLFRLCHEIDQKLSDLKVEREQQAGF